jgi:hypothetical protein
LDPGDTAAAGFDFVRVALPEEVIAMGTLEAGR